MSGDARTPIPPGTVSTIRGHWQAPILRRVTRGLIVLGLVSMAVPGAAGSVLGGAAVAMVVAVPLLRVGWLVRRWAQERDRRFVVLGTGLLAVVGLGAVLAALGVG